MDGEKPFIEQMKESVPSGEDVKESFTEVANNIGESIQEIKDSVSNTINEFSNKSVVEGSNEFLDSNSLLAKFAFIIMIVIVFMVVLKIMIGIFGYFLAPSRNPYIVKGALSGSDKQIITQDPSKDNTIQVFKSNDRGRGLEYTWSVWLFLMEADVSNTPYNIFVKGAPNFDTTSGDGYQLNVVNGPGMYITYEGTEYKLTVVMDHIGNETITSNDADSGRDIIEVDSIPIKKWVHVAARMQNTVLDIYVNGTIAKRHNMLYAPKQNFYPVVICGNDGFKGKLSNLRYYSKALNVFEINNVVMTGPNTNSSELSVDSQAKTGIYSYLSNNWYTND